MKSDDIWLENGLIHGPFITLATTKDAFHFALDNLKIDRDGRSVWCRDGADATCHFLKNTKGQMACVVTLNSAVQDSGTGIYIASLLVHEAVHVFQYFCDEIGEKSPSSEFQAYSIQAIANALMTSYAEQKGLLDS